VIVTAGTVISIHTSKDNFLTKPILNRLQQRDTMLRTSADPSMLVHSLLDLGERHFSPSIYFPFISILSSNEN
jgi:hypothetical protein